MSDAVITEIGQLHDFFERWFRGGVEPEGFERMERVMAPEFTIVTPEGQVLDRAGILAAVRAGRGSREVEIRVENARILWRVGAVTCARYDERHTGAGRRSLRRSTALFREAEAAPNGVEWLHVHETWVEQRPA